MKGLFSVLVVALFVVVVSAATQEEVKKMVSDCGKENNYDKDHFDNIDDEKQGCTLHCVYKKLGKVNADGKMDAAKTVDLYVKNHPNLSEKIKKAVTECAEEGNKEKDCKVSVSYVKCLHKKLAAKPNQTTENPVNE